MKVAVSITKVFEVDSMDLEKLRHQFEREDYENGIDWYEVNPEQEIWSYAIVEN